MEENKQPVGIAIFASGSGTNALSIIRYFNETEEPVAKVVLVVSSHKDAGVLSIAKNYNIPSIVLDKKSFYETEEILNTLESYAVQFIALAGFIWYVPQYIVRRYKGKIVNIHPALLPAYGGKGMYGLRVHEEVIKNKEKESGFTIHYVNEEYDAGEIIFQFRVPVFENDTPQSLQNRIKRNENYYYPRIIEKIILEKFYLS